MNRRDFLVSAAAATVIPAPGLGSAPRTRFQIACMTLPYSRFSLERALSGIHAAGFKFVAFGTTHQVDGNDVPIFDNDTTPEKARQLGQRCRDLGLEPLMMFSSIYPERDDAVAVFNTRLKQAAAARIPQLLTFGHTKGSNRKVWVERFKQLGPIAKELNVTIVIKQHGGETGTGEACADIVREIDQSSVQVNYDAGNVMDYLHVDPIADLKKCSASVRSFCIKDHRNFPKDQDCGPGFGEIDHYKLLSWVASTGLTMPLCCENIFAPLLPRPEKPEAIDQLARRAREYLEMVVAGLATL